MLTVVPGEGSGHEGREKEGALAEIWGAEDKDHALAAIKPPFGAAYGGKFPMAVAKITGDLGGLLAFCEYAAEHRVHLRTVNPVGPAFAAVRHRTKVTKGPGARAAGLAKLEAGAEHREAAA